MADPLSMDFDWDMDGPSDFERGPNKDSTRHWHVIMDFDGTITEKDTLDALVCQTIIYTHEVLNGDLLLPEDVENTGLGKAWEQCKAQYVDDLRARDKGCSYLEASEENTLQSAIEILESMRPLEELSLERINGAHIFDFVDDYALRDRAFSSGRGISPKDIAESGKLTQYGVTVRAGLADFTKELERRPGSSWGVVSVNWSRGWIGGILMTAVESDNEESISIISNAPLRLDDGQAAGVQGYPLEAGSKERTLILTTEDKIKAMKHMLAEFARRSTTRAPRPPSVYIGDSTTDLSCLLSADVGIIMLPPPTSSQPPDVINNPVISMFQTCGFATRHVNEYQKLYRKSEEDGEDNGPFIRALYASSFEEILESQMLNDDYWQPATSRGIMNHEVHDRNRR